MEENRDPRSVNEKDGETTENNRAKTQVQWLLVRMYVIDSTHFHQSGDSSFDRFSDSAYFMIRDSYRVTVASTDSVMNAHF